MNDVSACNLFHLTLTLQLFRISTSIGLTYPALNVRRFASLVMVNINWPGGRSKLQPIELKIGHNVI